MEVVAIDRFGEDIETGARLIRLFRFGLDHVEHHAAADADNDDDPDRGEDGNETTHEY